jgi:hypothetical protein
VWRPQCGYNMLYEIGWPSTSLESALCLRLSVLFVQTPEGIVIHRLTVSKIKDSDKLKTYIRYVPEFILFMEKFMQATPAQGARRSSVSKKGIEALISGVRLAWGKSGQSNRIFIYF